MLKKFIATAVGVAGIALPIAASAGIVTANCTGMFNLDIYLIDLEKPTQDVEGIGRSQVIITDAEILLEGAFGVYRFDLEVGTLYHNEGDTGVYCTYKGLPS